jgi:hypothetical protein
MKKVIRFKDFVVEDVNVSTMDVHLNEGLFDTLKSLFGKIGTMFKDTAVLNKQVDAAAVKAGATDDKVAAKTVKAGTTLIVKLQDPKDEAKKLLISFTKLADMPDGSGLFQMTGTDSPEFMKTLGVKDVMNLNTIGVLAIIAAEGFVENEPLKMRVYKNLSKDGKEITTQTVVKAALSADTVMKEKPE